MKIDIPKIDLSKFDITKIDIDNIITVKWIALAVLLIVFIFDLSLFLSLSQGIKQAQAQRNKDVAAVGFFKGLISRKDVLTQAKIISQDSIDDLLVEIQDIAEKNNIRGAFGGKMEKNSKQHEQDIEIDAGANTDEGFYTQKILSINASGSYKNLGIFISSLKDVPDAVLAVKSVHLTNDQDDIDNVQANITLTVLMAKVNEDQ